MIPDWWEFALLALAAFRVWKLLAEDVIFDRFRERLLELFETNPARASAIFGFLACGWCLGFWVAVAWWLAWLVWSYGVLVFATPWALATIVGVLVQALNERESE